MLIEYQQLPRPFSVSLVAKRVILDAKFWISNASLLTNFVNAFLTNFVRTKYVLLCSIFLNFWYGSRIAFGKRSFFFQIIFYTKMFLFGIGVFVLIFVVIISCFLMQLSYLVSFFIGFLSQAWAFILFNLLYYNWKSFCNLFYINFDFDYIFGFFAVSVYVILVKSLQIAYFGMF